MVPFVIDPKVEAYTQRAVREAHAACGSNLRSVILFGSATRGEFSPSVSDIDLIFVVSDDTSSKVLAELESTVTRLEQDEGLSRNQSHFLRLFSSRTAMFRSHFILSAGTLRSMKIQQLFREAQGFNLPLGGFLLHFVPSELVVRNVFARASEIYGDHFLDTLIMPVPGSSSLVKSFIVSISLSLFGAVASLLFPDGTMVSLESVKWFLLGLQSLQKGSSNIRDAVDYAQRFGGSFVLRKFTDLRQHYRRSITFSLVSPIYLAYLFSGAFRRGLAH